MDDSTRKFDAPTVAILRQALNEVVTDRRFLVRKSLRRWKWRSTSFNRQLPANATSTG
jgi:hypothetical protein